VKRSDEIAPPARPAPGRADILVVADHQAREGAVEAILGPLGHEVLKVATGDEALRHVLARDPALVVVQLEAGGLEAVKLIRQRTRGRHPPIIVVVPARHDPALVARAYAAGAVDVLTEPVDADILRSKAMVLVHLHLEGEKIKAQERRLRQREFEALQRSSEERYHRLIDAMPQSMWAAGSDGHINYWNRALLESCGLDAAASESAFWEVLHPEDRAEARAQWETAVRGGQPFEREVRMKRSADGSYRWHLARAVPERDVSGVVIGWIATATDIGDQKRAEEALQQAVAQRDEFLSVASHELRTPLTSLKLELANLSRLARRAEAVRSDRLQPKVEKIQNQAERLHRLIDELLDVSRIAAGRLELQLEAVDLARVATDVGRRLLPEAERNGCELVIRAPEPVIGRWDKSRLEQVVANLLSNALKYGQCKPVEITVEGGDGRARLTVRDHGLGIAPHDQHRIFGRFERAASSRNFGGIGLGLWIVSQIVDAFGGKVGVESQLGEGATFRVELPSERARAHPVEMPPAPPLAVAAGALHSLP
jgi:PAS domain S-box-containing protein